MTPRQLADKYPAQWQLFPHRAKLRIGLCEIKVFEEEEITTMTVWCESRMSSDTDLDDLVTFESVPDAIGYLLAREIVRDPAAVDLYKIPDWAKDATRLALDPHRRRIEETQTHLEWSKK